MIRQLDASFLNEMIQIEQRVYRYPWSSVAIQECFNSDAYRIWGYVYRNQLKAYAICQLIVDEGHLLNIAVAPESQRQGIANDLMIHLERELKHEGATSVFLEVRFSNQPAIELYQKHGYQELGLRKSYYQNEGIEEDARVMQKNLV